MLKSAFECRSYQLELKDELITHIYNRTNLKSQIAHDINVYTVDK